MFASAMNRSGIFNGKTSLEAFIRVHLCLSVVSPILIIALKQLASASHWGTERKP